MQQEGVSFEGKSGFHVEFGVTVSEMREWEPERILRFFEGIAQMIRARCGNPK